MGTEASHQGIMSDGASLIPRKLSSSVKASIGRLHFLSPCSSLFLALMLDCEDEEKKNFNKVPIRLPLSSLMHTSHASLLTVQCLIIGIPSLNRRNQICLLSVCARKLVRQPFAYAKAQNHYSLGL